MIGLLTAEVVPESRWTLYKALGDWFLWFCGALITAGTWSSVRSRRGVPPTAQEQRAPSVRTKGNLAYGGF